MVWDRASARARAGTGGTYHEIPRYRETMGWDGQEGPSISRAWDWWYVSWGSQGTMGQWDVPGDPAALSTCYAITNLELTSSHTLSLLSLNCYTGIASPAITPQMLCKQKNSTHNSRQDYFLLKSLDRIACTDFKYTEMSIAPRGRGISFEVFRSPFGLESWPFHIKEFLQPV